MRAAQLSTLLFWILCLSAPVVNAESTPPPPDSLLAAIQARIAWCDSLWTDMTYVALTHERELRSDGTVKNEKTFRTRVYARHEIGQKKEEREILEAMWENGELVSAAALNDEREKRDKERRKRAREENDGTKQKKRRRQISRVLEPFHPENAGNYEFEPPVLDTRDGLPVLKIGVVPLFESEDLVRGTAWVATETYRAVAEEYEPAKLPSKVKALAFELGYESIGPDCAMPRWFEIAGRGQVLFFIKFRFEADVTIDSVTINPGLPDSLFIVPAE